MAEPVNLLTPAQVWHAEDILIDCAGLQIVIVGDVLVEMRAREHVIPALPGKRSAHTKVHAWADYTMPWSGKLRTF